MLTIAKDVGNLTFLAASAPMIGWSLVLPVALDA
jgi:hypothetical protein